METMRAEELVRVLKRRPFEPSALHMSNGSHYPVHHPDAVIVTPRAAYVGIREDGEQMIAQDVVICDLLHVTRIAPIRKRSRKRRSS